MCKKNITENTSENFIITNTILSMKSIFTFSEIVKRLKAYSIDNEKAIKSSIMRLRENDYLEEDGSYYRVLSNGESKRWGIC